MVLRGRRRAAPVRKSFCDNGLRRLVLFVESVGNTSLRLAVRVTRAASYFVVMSRLGSGA